MEKRPIMVVGGCGGGGKCWIAINLAFKTKNKEQKKGNKKENEEREVEGEKRGRGRGGRKEESKNLPSGVVVHDVIK
jgi:hypothetical protein